MRRLLAFALGLGLSASTFGCSSALQDSRSEELLAIVHEKELEHFVATFAIEAPTRAVLWAEQQVETPSWDTVAAQLGRDLDWDDEAVRLLTELHRSGTPPFVRGGRLTSGGTETFRMLAHAHREHGMDNRSWHLDEIEARMATLGRDELVRELHEALRIGPDDERRLREWLEARIGLDGTAPSHPDLARLLLADPEDNPLPRYSEAARALATKLAEGAMAAPELEILLAFGWLAMASEMRLANFYFIPRDVREEREWNIRDRSQRGEILRFLQREAFEEARESGFAHVMEHLEPPSEQYAGLRRSLVRYLEYVERGGWPEIDVPANRLREGYSGPEVLTLRERLHAEDYFDGALDSPEFDHALRRALLHYQHTHQLQESGVVDRITLFSLNVPAERRAAQIAVTLQRWRESTIGADFDRRHIRASLPDFHAELWEADERLMRFRTVIGSNRRARNPRTGEVELITATPTFYRSMRYVVFNPTWNIPPGIRQRDYDPRIEENPNYLEEQGYQLMVGDDGREWIRQPPGPTNPLGRVKFLFPNEHHVYFHDTPQRHLFSHPIRAYSSGCVRIQDAMDFARLLLRLDRGWNDRRIEDFIESQFDDPDNERWVSLIHPIPVHIEYYVVRYDDTGDTHFLADIYRWDTERVDAMESLLFGEADGVSGVEDPERAPLSVVSGP
ncbi:MAG: hypothetical protein EA398_09755 [Deltaproteobacteria bacterium]|nr:MAG: hypothetical protein EA398_09755 [Deltaproteobacteria bacterium]